VNSSSNERERLDRFGSSPEKGSTCVSGRGGAQGANWLKKRGEDLCGGGAGEGGGCGGVVWGGGGGAFFWGCVTRTFSYWLKEKKVVFSTLEAVQGNAVFQIGLQPRAKKGGCHAKTPNLVPLNKAEKRGIGNRLIRYSHRRGKCRRNGDHPAGWEARPERADSLNHAREHLKGKNSSIMLLDCRKRYGKNEVVASIINALTGMEKNINTMLTAQGEKEPKRGQTRCYCILDEHERVWETEAGFLAQFPAEETMGKKKKKNMGSRYLNG